MRTDRLKIIILLCSLALVLPFLCLTAEGKDFTVVIDPGHGGHDPGAIGRRGKEKNINLNVALKVGRLIQNNCKDVKVISTRRSDVFIPLDRRAQIANNAKADLFISIHTNSVARGRNVRGTETYTSVSIGQKKTWKSPKGKLCYFNRGQLSATLCRFQSELFGKLHHL